MVIDFKIESYKGKEVVFNIGNADSSEIIDHLRKLGLPDRGNYIVRNVYRNEKSTAFEIHMISHTKRKEMAKEALRETLRKLMNV